MSDSMLDPVLDPTAPSGSEPACLPAGESPGTAAAATATALSALGYGQFAWLQPGDLTAVQSMQAIRDAVLVETGASAGAGGSAHDVAAGEGLEAGWVTDTLFDEDLAAAQMLAALSTLDSDLGEPGDPAGTLEATGTPVAAASTDARAVVEQLPASYSTPRDTIAMLEEIAFLDE